MRVIAIVLFLFSQEAFAERLYGHFDPPKFKAERIGFKYEMDFFSADGNFPTGGGSKVSLPNTNSFSAFNFHLQVDYDWNSRFSSTFGLQLGSSSSEDIEFERSNSDLKAIFLGGFYRLRLIDNWITVADGFYYQALASNSSQQNEVSIGDGENWIGGGLWFGRRLPQNWRMWSYLGLRFRSGGLSDLLLYSIRPYLKKKNWKYGVGLEGYLSLFEDDLTDDPSPRLEISSNFNGNSLRYFSVNPDYHEVQAWLGYKFRPYTEMRFGFGFPFAGESTATGFRLFLTMETSIGWNKARGKVIFPFKPSKSSSRKIRRKNQKKKNYRKKKKTRSGLFKSKRQNKQKSKNKKVRKKSPFGNY